MDQRISISCCGVGSAGFDIEVFVQAASCFDSSRIQTLVNSDAKTKPKRYAVSHAHGFIDLVLANVDLLRTDDWA